MPLTHFWNLLAKKLSGEATPEELRELDALMRLHPDWLYSAQHLQDLWGSAPVEDSEETEAAFARHLEKMKEQGMEVPPAAEEAAPARPRGRRMGIAVGVAASLAAAALVFGFFRSSPPASAVAVRPAVSEVSTRPGSKSKLVLPDGSTVWLNAGSRLTYDKQFGTDHRQLELQGEAFFDVVKMPELPMVIRTQSMEIRVLGTAFNVKAYAGEPTTETSLIRGKVEIVLKDRPGEKFFLKPNEKLVVANAAGAPQASARPLYSMSPLTYRAQDSSVVELAWTENKLVFQDESFYDLARRLERWYNVQVRFTDESIGGLRFTGVFESESVTQALEALQITAPFQFKKEGSLITITP
ncbi:MAG TPA: FecR domain-containing protein [Chitinophagaceae bacterium]|jgi:ferric-dicitrate binding protein FerR (iron transport regulator)|nr:FecR domain-containing protein [Chitinophagaceae bacterium]